MNMWLDIYALSRHRNNETVKRFLHHFCDEEEAKQRDNFEIDIAESKKYGTPGLVIPVNTRLEAVSVGIANPEYSFAFYFYTSSPEIKSATVQFTYDGKIIFGLSIEDRAYGSQDALTQAQQKVQELMWVTQADKFFISCEYPSPEDEEEFDTDAALWQELIKQP